MKSILKILFLFSVAVGIAVCQQGAINLKRDLFKNYDPQSRPVENSSTITNVCAGLYVLQIVGLSEKSQVIWEYFKPRILDRKFILFFKIIDYVSQYPVGVYLGKKFEIFFLFSNIILLIFNSVHRVKKNF